MSSALQAVVGHCDYRRGQIRLTRMPKAPRRYSSAHVDVRRGNGCVLMALSVVRSKDSDGLVQSVLAETRAGVVPRD